MSEETTENASEKAEGVPEDLINIHDLEQLKKLWFMYRAAESSNEVFALTHLLLDSLPYDWIDKNDNWLHLAQQLEEHGEQEIASLFKLANQKAFTMMREGK